MKVPEYITPAEVQRICKDLGLSDWTALKKTKVSPEEAKIVLKALSPKNLKVDVNDFRQGLQIELEHGKKYKDANVTNNHPLITGKIVLAHLRETLDYYKRLEIIEIQGDLFKAVKKGEGKKIKDLYKKLIFAQLVLSKEEFQGISSQKRPA